MFTFSLIWSPYTFKLCPVWQTMAWWSLKCLLRRVCWSHLGSSVLPSCSGVTLDTLNSMSYCAQPPHCASHVPASSVVWPELPPWCRMSAQGPPQEQITTDMGDTLAMSRVALWSLLTTGNKELDFFILKESTFLASSHWSTWKVWIELMFTPFLACGFTAFSSCLQIITGLHTNTFRSFQLKTHHRLNIIVI